MPEKQKRKERKAIRHCEISSDLFKQICEYGKGKDSSAFLFPYSIKTLYNKFNQLLSKFGHSSHDLRHARLTELSAGGMSLANLQKFAGHSDPKTTAGYVTVSNEDMLQQVRAIDKNTRSKKEELLGKRFA